MNTLRPSITAIVALVSIMAVRADDSKTPAELIKMREEYQRRQDAAIEPVKAWYRQQLQQAEQLAINRRDLEGALALKQERESLTAPPVGAPIFRVIKATYGTGDKTVDVTKQVQALVHRNALGMKSPWAFGVDPAFGSTKELKVQYSYGSTEKTATFGQNATIALP